MIEKKPLVSVIITCRKSEDIKAAIEGIDRQGYKNIEMIVCGNEKVAELRECWSKYECSRFILMNMANMAETYKSAIEFAKGEYYLWMDAKSPIEKGYIEKTITLLGLDNDEPFICSDYKEFGYAREQRKNITKDPGRVDGRILGLLQDGVVRSVKNSRLQSDIGRMLSLIEAFQYKEEYTQKQQLVAELHDSKAWRLTLFLRRIASLWLMRPFVYLGKFLLQPKQSVSRLRSAMGDILGDFRYRNAWSISDRWDEASDNGILFYRYLAKEQPHINAYYVISKSSPDFERLNSEGVKVVDNSSLEHKRLVRNADVELSAFFNFAAFDPSEVRRKKPALKRVFLLHGVDQPDLSLHYARIGMDMYCAATDTARDFYKTGKSLVDISDKNIQSTGLLRHDLARVKLQQKPKERKKIVIAPSWRRFLVFKPGTSIRIPKEDIVKTKYYAYYMDLFHSAELKRLSQQYDIVFIPHPELLGTVSMFNLPEYIRVATYKELGTDKLYDLALETKLFISDFSSTVFDFAFLGANVVYFDFDEEDYYSGKHELYKGWFDIERDGFGPHFTDISSLKQYLSDDELWTRYEDKIAAIWSQIPESAGEAVYNNVQDMLGRGE